MKIADPIVSVLQNKSPALWRIAPDALVFDAIQLMSDRNIGCLLVMDDAELLGIISERDYTRNVILKGRSSKSTLVSEIMTTGLVTITPDATVERALQTMTEHSVRHLPIVQNEKLIGIVSIGDLVKWIMSAQGAMIEQLENYIQGSYPA